MANSLRTTTVFGVAARMSSVNCRSVAASAASGMLLTSPMLMQLDALSSIGEAEQPESMKSGIGRPLFGGHQCRAPRLRGRQRLVEIGDDVVDMLNADGKPNHLRLDARLAMLLGRHLPVRGRSWVAGERLGI